MNHKFNLNEVVKILSYPGYTGKIVMIELYEGKNQPRYLLDCFPGALVFYHWYIHPDGYGDDKVLTGNWFDEDELIY